MVPKKCKKLIVIIFWYSERQTCKQKLKKNFYNSALVLKDRSHVIKRISTHFFFLWHLKKLYEKCMPISNELL